MTPPPSRKRQLGSSSAKLTFGVRLWSSFLWLQPVERGGGGRTRWRTAIIETTKTKAKAIDRLDCRKMLNRWAVLQETPVVRTCCKCSPARSSTWQRDRPRVWHAMFLVAAVGEKHSKGFCRSKGEIKDAFLLSNCKYVSVEKTVVASGNNRKATHTRVMIWAKTSLIEILKLTSLCKKKTRQRY